LQKTVKSYDLLEKTGRFWRPRAYERTRTPKAAKPETLPSKLMMIIEFIKSGESKREMFEQHSLLLGSSGFTPPPTPNSPSPHHSIFNMSSLGISRTCQIKKKWVQISLYEIFDNVFVNWMNTLLAVP